MKNNSYVKDVLLRKRTLGNWMSVGVSIFFFLLSIIYVCVDQGAMKITDYSNTLAFVMLLVGSLITLSTLFYNVAWADRIAPFVSLCFYAVALGRQLYLFAYPIADKATGVNWFGGNFAAYCTFFVLMLIGVVVQIVALFFPQVEAEEKKSVSETK